MADGSQQIRFGSVCSGIEAASAAWYPLGWRASFLSEIEPFSRAVLQHHYPEVPLHGDFTTIKADQCGRIDLLVGGTPCQDFSVAGGRAGLGGARGNLTLEYARLARRLGARWLVWENVPGVFSSNAGRDFGAVLACFAGYADDTFFTPPVNGWRSAGIVPAANPNGYGLAWRVLDAQFAGVPQRRRRVFVVGYLGDWRRAAAVLLELESLSGNPPPRRKAGQGTAVGALTDTSPGGGWRVGAGADEAAAGQLILEVSRALTTSNQRINAETETFIVARPLRAQAQHSHRDDSETYVTHALRAEGFDASEDGTGCGTPLVPVAFDTTQITSAANRSNPRAGDPCHPLAAGAHVPAIAFSIMPQNSGKDYKAREVEVAQPLMAGGPVGGNQGGDYIVQPLAFDCKASGRNGFGVGEIASTQRAMSNAASHTNGGGHHAVLTGAGVRRLMPIECERLQGFPDGWTSVPFRGKPAADGPRYKALGNSMAVPCMRWLGERISLVEELMQTLEQRRVA